MNDRTETILAPDLWHPFPGFRPDRSGYFLVYLPKPGRQYVAWFDAIAGKFDTVREISHFRALPEPPLNGHSAGYPRGRK